ncbi:MAG: glycosyltransferase, partial [Candidatus Aenigmarchaeota archaeon]|nr:glycosyltransferase [Candidatus Aenigmarchaeota archaeon]
KREIDRLKQSRFPSHKEIRARKIKERKLGAIRGEFGPEVSVIIPYMHTAERYPLFMSCISSLSSNVEICVVEIGKKRCLYLPPEDFEYMFVEYHGVMHRGWALNLGVKHLSTGRKLVLLDADVIVPDNFFQKIKDVNYSCVAWDRMFYLNQKSTKQFIKRKLNKGEDELFKKFAKEELSEVVKTPRLDGPAGGITIVPRKMYFQAKGVPENFEGTWGGPDNTLMAKLRAFGHPFKTLECDSIHLWHTKNTPRKNKIALKARDMIRWTKNQWSNEINNIGNNWGNKKKGVNQPRKMTFIAPTYMTIENLKNVAVGNLEQQEFSSKVVIDDLCKMWPGFNRGTLERVFNCKETILSVAMLSLLRTEIMLKMLDHWDRTMYIPSNIAFNVQGEEWLKPVHRDMIEDRIERNFDKSHLIFTRSNRGTGVPRHNMVHKALDFKTPYIMTTDDDMFFPPGSVEALISILEDNPELGAVDMWVHPNLNAWFMRPDRMDYKQPKIPFGYVDGMGSATMVMRREVFETCDYDHHYYVGWADIDFCMQIRKSKWKLGILALP